MGTAMSSNGTSVATGAAVRRNETMLAHNSQVSSALIAAFAVVYLIWGSTFLAIRIGLESFPPLLLAGTRHLTVGLILLPMMLWKTGERPTLAQWRTSLITGFLLLTVGNGAVCVAEQKVPSGIAALLVATVCLWMVLVDWVRPGGVRPGPRVFVGLVLGFAGMVLLVSPANLGGAGRVNPMGATILVLGSLAWGAGSIYSRHAAVPHSPMLGAAMQSFAGGIILWIGGLANGEGRALHPTLISTRSWLAVVYLVVFGSALGFTAYVYILKKSTAARVATYALVNPVVALFLGWLLVAEPITLRTLLASAIILGAVRLVITAPHRATAAGDEILPVPDEA
jgi:drug/metabolite transporter (DMT)-like permease